MGSSGTDMPGTLGRSGEILKEGVKSVRGININEKKEIIEYIVDVVVEAFLNSEYPSRAFDFIYFFDEQKHQGIEIHIRIPPIRPDYVNEKYGSYREKNTACPAIENIIVPVWMRRQGFFSHFVSSLGKIPEIDAICVSHVTNHGFSQYLEKNHNWVRLDYGYPENSPIARFAAMEPPTYCRMFIDGC